MSSRDRIWVKVYRQEALSKQSGRCLYCKCQLSTKTCTADHKRARKNGGRTTRDNITAVCAYCNSVKGHMGDAKFLSLIKGKPTAGTAMPIMRIWMRRKIEIQIIRSCKNIDRMFQAGSD